MKANHKGVKHVPALKSGKPAKSLTEFLLDKRREGCPLCALSQDVKDQLKLATKRSIKRAEQMEWLAEEFGLKFTVEQFNTHHAGRHEAP
jgi:hypothetical protein